MGRAGEPWKALESAQSCCPAGHSHISCPGGSGAHVHGAVRRWSWEKRQQTLPWLGCWTWSSCCFLGKKKKITFSSSVAVVLLYDLILEKYFMTIIWCNMVCRAWGFRDRWYVYAAEHRARRVNSRGPGGRKLSVRHLFAAVHIIVMVCLHVVLELVLFNSHPRDWAGPCLRDFSANLLSAFYSSLPHPSLRSVSH